MQQKLVQFGENPAIQDLLAADRSTAPCRRTTAWSRSARWPGRGRRNCPRPGSRRSCARCRPTDVDVTRQALSVARAVPVDQRRGGRSARGASARRRQRRAPLDVRLDALAAVPGGLTSVDPDLFDAAAHRSGTDAAGSHSSGRGSVVEKAQLDREATVGPDGIAREAPARWSFRGSCPRSTSGSDEALGLAMLGGVEAVEGPVERARRHPSPAPGEISAESVQKTGRGAAGVAQRRRRASRSSVSKSF